MSEPPGYPMPDILHDFPVSAPPERVFAALCSPAALNAWWTLRSEGRPGPGERYRFYFSPEYDWAGTVSVFEPGRSVEWELTTADEDWRGTRVGFRLSPIPGGTRVAFSHTGWPAANDHYRTSSFCWAMYLRLFKRFLETGEVVPYDRRLDV